MLISGAIISGCIYCFSKEVAEMQDRKANHFAKILSPNTKNTSPKKRTALQQIKTVWSILADDQRTKQFNEVVPSEISKEEKHIEEELFVSKVTLGFAVACTFVPPLGLATFAGLLIGMEHNFKEAFKSLKKGKMDSEVLIAIADAAILASGYYIIAAIDVIIYNYSKKILLKTEDKTIDKLVNVFEAQPKSVWLAKNNLEVEVPYDGLEKGNIISIRAGEMIPVDGEIVKGEALINQQALTGETQPVEKRVGSSCLASTVLLEGHIHIEVDKMGKETVAAQIEETLKQSIDYREVMLSKGQDTADQVAVPMVALSVASLPFLGLTGAGAIAVSSNIFLVQLVAPVVALNFLSIASEEGILIKDGRVLELLHQVDTVVFDKAVIELHTSIRPEAKAIIQNLQAINKTCYIISSDQETPTQNLAQELGVAHYFAEVLPANKAKLIATLQAQNKKVCFIGDGINDAPALKKATVAISLRGASSIAMDTAQIVLMTKNLQQLPLLFEIGEQFDQQVKSALKIWGLASVISITGTLFFGVGLKAAIVLSEIALALSVSNAIHPILTYEQAKERAKDIQIDIKKQEKSPTIPRLTSGHFGFLPL